ncbi:MAG: hypothetical protein J2P25_08975 [Nocardiopsaceae bacterium]|nr:hypothetical protein [Nocardiopsaceae bacterium]
MRVVHVDAVKVIFIDGADGGEVGRSNLPADQLPETFGAGTNVDIDGTSWLVERAEPESAAQWRASRTLTLTLRRASSPAVPARDILFSLPSICDVLPAVADNQSRADALEIHEDDWRQVEMVADSLSGMIQSELRAIQATYDERARRASDGGIIGFDSIHVRAQLARPLPVPLSLRQVLSMLPRPSRQYAGVAFEGMPGVAVDSFAMAFGGVSLYGLADGDAIESLCLGRREVPEVPDAGPPGLIPGLRAVLDAFDLVIIDWCQCSVIGPDSVAGYLSRPLPVTRPGRSGRMPSPP